MAESTVLEAVKKALEGSKQRKFTETVELALNLKGIDLSVPKNRIDDDVLLPRGRGKPAKIAVFATGELAVKSKGCADLVIAPEQIDDYAGDRKKAKKLAGQFNFFIAEAPLMPAIGKKLGPVLAPRGKMPRPVPPTIDPAPLVNNLRSTIRIRTRDKKTFHAPVGTRGMKPEEIADNVEAVLKKVISRLERGKQNIASVFLKTTMGASVKVM